MRSHSAISPQEAADRLAVRELIDAYAHCADRRDAKGQMALFTEDTRFLVFMDATAAEPTQALQGREALAPVFDNLDVYQATTHFNGQSTVSLAGNRASARRRGRLAEVTGTAGPTSPKGIRRPRTRPPVPMRQRPVRRTPRR